MSSQRSIAINPDMRALKRVLGALSTAAVVVLVSLSTQQTTAQPAFAAFDAQIAGYFFLSGANGESPLFVVEERGTGSEVILGDFNYTTDLLQNLARIPGDCGPDSSTGVDGFGIMEFADGEMWLHRVSGSACFSPPMIVLNERWRIAGGTGAYANATGKLVRTFTGDISTFPFQGFGSFSGTIKL